MLETFVPIPYVDEEVTGASTTEPPQKTSTLESDKTKTVPPKGKFRALSDFHP